MRRWLFWGSTAILGAILVLTISVGLQDNTRELPPSGSPAKYNESSVSETIPRLVKQVSEDTPGVKTAWPVVTGNDVIIGIELADNAAQQNPASIEQEVARRVKAGVSSVDRVDVTADPQNVSRLRTLAEPSPRAGTRDIISTEDELADIRKNMQIPGPGADPNMEANTTSSNP